MASSDQPPIPVTILSGFLGSGKTTLLKYILESSEHQKKIAVIVNDMAELNIDAALIQQNTDGSIVQAEREVISLQNGCICCTLRGDLIREIARIRKGSNNFDYVLIESTGIAEPQQVAESFCFDPDTAELAQSEEQMLWTQARLDTCVTVIDAHSFPLHMASLQQFSDSFQDGLDTSTEEGVKEGEKGIASLMVEQVEFANVILFNKTDLVSEKDQATTLKLIKKLNPNAKVIPTQYAKVAIKEIINTGLFDMEKASESPGWLVSLQESKSATPNGSEADEYGVGSFVYRSRKPFHPNRITLWFDSIVHFAQDWQKLSKDARSQESDEKYKAMQEEYGNILRTKGFIWMAGCDSLVMGLAQSGRLFEMTPIMPWYAVIPEDQWGAEDAHDLAVIKARFEGPHGDRRQEIVFIGTNLNVDAIRKSLDACLLTKKELNRYQFYSDKGFV